MNFNEVERKIKSIIVDKLGIDESELTPDAHFNNDLGADSLDTVELVMEMEKEFDIAIPDDLAEKMTTYSKGIDLFLDYNPRQVLSKIETRVLSFRFADNGRIEVSFRFEDGSWRYADGSERLPSNICILSFSKWANILKELEDIINDTSSKEADLQYFFESYPELLAGNDYGVVLPQAVIEKEDNSNWKPDFVLTPSNQYEFAKIIDLKIPSMITTKRPQSGHYNFSAKLYNAINQIRDYSREFDKQAVRDRFKNKYQVDVYKPDLQLIAGRKWDMKIIDKMRELQRETQVKIEDWDTVLDRLKRNYT